MTPYFKWDDLAEFVVTVTAERGIDGVGYKIKGQQMPILAMPLGWRRHRYLENAAALARIWAGWTHTYLLQETYGNTTAEFVFADGGAS